MIVRKQQLASLNELYTTSGNQCVILSAANGSEHMDLIRSFVADKKYFYYHARSASALEQYRRFAAEIEEFYDVKLHKGTYAEIFNRIRSGDASKLVLVIDEFQQIVKREPEFIDALRKLKGKKLYPGSVLIVLCTTDIHWVRTEMDAVFADTGRLVDWKIGLGDLQFLDVVRQFPNYSVADSVRTYATVGGVASYMKRWDDRKTYKQNVCDLIVREDGVLFFEAENLIGAGLRELSIYNTILYNIASGKRKLNDLYHATGFSRAKISVYIKNLMEYDIVEKALSFETGGYENTQKGLYQISNHFVNFWFHFIYPNLSNVYRMEPEAFYDTYIEPAIDEYLNRYFVLVCQEYLTLLNRMGQLPYSIAKMGTWIGKQGTIDILAQDTARNTIVGLCNWSKDAFELADCEALNQTMKKAKIKSEHIYLFSATAFSEELKAWSDSHKEYVLVDMKEL